MPRARSKRALICRDGRHGPAFTGCRALAPGKDLYSAAWMDVGFSSSMPASRGAAAIAAPVLAKCTLPSHLSMQPDHLKGRLSNTVQHRLVTQVGDRGAGRGRRDDQDAHGGS